jgi:hypothetical protein
MTDTTTQTGRDGAKVSAAAPCRTPACASYAGGLTQRQARSARVQILIRDGRHADDSLAPLWAKPNDEDPRRDLREVTREIRPDWVDRRCPSTRRMRAFTASRAVAAAAVTPFSRRF